MVNAYLTIFSCLVLGSFAQSRLRIEANYSNGKGNWKGATVRMFDPLTEETFHMVKNPAMVETLAKLWNPIYQPGKCGSRNLYHDQNYTRICDPEDFLPPSQAEAIQKIVYRIPRVTGCQCDSFQHCNHYESGFSLYVVVVPTILQPLGTMQMINGSYQFGLLPLLYNAEPKKSPAFRHISPVNLVIPKALKGHKIDVIPEDSSIFDLVAHYLRALWATGSCDEDMIICFFPKEKQISISIGGRLLQKLTISCIESAYADIRSKLSGEEQIALTPEAAAKREEELAVLDKFSSPDDQPVSMSRAASIAKRQQKELLKMTSLLVTFIERVDKLIQSRSETPCANHEPRMWSHFEIASFAVAAGIGLSIVLALMLRLCSILSEFIDQFIDDEPNYIDKNNCIEQMVAPRLDCTHTGHVFGCYDKYDRSDRGYDNDKRLRGDASSTNTEYPMYDLRKPYQPLRSQALIIEHSPMVKRHCDSMKSVETYELQPTTV